MASVLKGQSGQPIQFETVPNVNGDDVAVMANVGPVTNFDSATGTVTIPSGLEIGTRRLIRKIHPTQGTVTINCTGETFTRAGLASVELNADGDYWLLEKVTANRWELVDGVESGENSNGEWTRYNNGSCELRISAPLDFSVIGRVVYQYPISTIPNSSRVSVSYGGSSVQGNWEAYQGSAVMHGDTSMSIAVTVTMALLPLARILVSAKWYE